MLTSPLLRKIIVLLLVVSITFLHYTTADTFLFHVLYRELYFLPILLIAFWFGLGGGLVTSLAIAVL